MSRRSYSAAYGSSPLTRGKPSAWTNYLNPFGLIPAHAGKTGCVRARRRRSRAHPRSRGENMQAAMQLTRDNGSSPLTRGKRVPGAPCDDGDGLIPAHAGKTSPHVSPGTPRKAHPRSRGENRGWWGCPARDLGSSPLTRGKRVPGAEVRLRAGLIPAHAGKTSKRRPPSSPNGAHPRSRGENISSGRSALPTSGSSPLTRGKPLHRLGNMRGRGLIPAHAGKTRSCLPASPLNRAHPRSRGENALTTPDNE